jgi:hypothetical protein
MFSTGKTCQVYGKTGFILRLRKVFLGVDRRWPWLELGLWGLENFFEKSVLRLRIGDFGVETGAGVRCGGVGLVGRVARDGSPFQKTRMSPFCPCPPFSGMSPFFPECPLFVCPLFYPLFWLMCSIERNPFVY